MTLACTVASGCDAFVPITQEISFRIESISTGEAISDGRVFVTAKVLVDGGPSVELMERLRSFENQSTEVGSDGIATVSLVFQRICPAVPFADPSCATAAPDDSITGEMYVVLVESGGTSQVFEVRMIEGTASDAGDVRLIVERIGPPELSGH
jgi:hypothetical protein